MDIYKTLKNIRELVYEQKRLSEEYLGKLHKDSEIKINDSSYGIDDLGAIVASHEQAIEDLAKLIQEKE